MILLPLETEKAIMLNLSADFLWQDAASTSSPTGSGERELPLRALDTTAGNGNTAAQQRAARSAKTKKKGRKAPVPVIDLTIRMTESMQDMQTRLQEGEELFPRARRFGEKHPGARFSLLRIWSAPHFYRPMIVGENRESVSLETRQGFNYYKHAAARQSFVDAQGDSCEKCLTLEVSPASTHLWEMTTEGHNVQDALKWWM